jgi:hypothetical protein
MFQQTQEVAGRAAGAAGLARLGRSLAFASVALGAYGCVAVRAPVGSLSSERALSQEQPAVPPAEVELWVESNGRPTPGELSAFSSEARAVLDRALSRYRLSGDATLIARERGLSRTDARRREQVAAGVGIAVAVVAVVAIAVAAASSGKGGGHGGGHGAAHVSHPIPAGGGSGAAAGHVAAAVARSTSHAWGAGHAAGGWRWAAGHPRSHVDLGYLCCLGDPWWREEYGYAYEVPFDGSDAGYPMPAPGWSHHRMPDPGDAMEDGEEEPPPPPQPPAPIAKLAPLPPLPLEERGTFDGDRTVLQLDLVDRATGAVLWSKGVANEEDPRDPQAVARLLSQALAGQRWAKAQR